MAKRRQFSPSLCDHRHSTWVPRKRITTKFWSSIGLYCVNCTRFGQLIIRKIIKIVATRCHIFSLKCIKIDLSWGSDRPRWGSLQRPPPRSSSWISEVLLLREANGWEGEKRKGQRRGGKGRKGKERGLKPPPTIYWNDAAGNAIKTIKTYQLHCLCFYNFIHRPAKYA